MSPNDYGPVPISRIKAESTAIFEALGAGRRVWISRYGRVVAVIDPPRMMPATLVMAYALPGDRPIAELNASEINQGSPSAAVTAALEGAAFYVTRDNLVYGHLRKVTEQEVATGLPTLDQVAQRERHIDEYLKRNPKATAEDLASLAGQAIAIEAQDAVEEAPHEVGEDDTKPTSAGLAISVIDVAPDTSILDLVTRARARDPQSWDQIVERYAPLVWAMCQRFHLSHADADDVGARVWLRLVERLDTIREPAALPGWLATTTRHECLRVLRAKARERPSEDHERVVDDTYPTTEDRVLAQERLIALRTALAGLSERCRQLLELLYTDPVVPYDEIGAMLEMPVGAIGPTRQRCLGKLRAALTYDDQEIIADLREVLDSEREVPATLIEAGKAAFD